jgi:RNA polymerase primary sigma factor
MEYLRSLKYYENNELPKIECLTNEEQFDLENRIKNGDKKALDELVVANLPLVYKTAKKWHIKDLELSDLISEGNIALIKAAKNYNSRNKTIYFTHYASICIKSAFNDLAKKRHIQKMPEIILENIGDDKPTPEDDYELSEAKKNLKEDLKKLNKMEQFIINKRFNNGKELKIAEIEKELGIANRGAYEVLQTAFKKLRKYQRSRYD